MAGFSDYLEDAIINSVLRNTAFPAEPANVYISLHSADPGDTGTNELSGNGYARKAVSTTGGFSAPSGGATSNAAEILFDAASGAWSAATHFGIWDDDGSPAGNLLFSGELSAPKTAGTGDQIRFAAGDLDIALS